MKTGHVPFSQILATAMGHSAVAVFVPFGGSGGGGAGSEEAEVGCVPFSHIPPPPLNGLNIAAAKMPMAAAGVMSVKMGYAWPLPPPHSSPPLNGPNTTTTAEQTKLQMAQSLDLCGEPSILFKWYLKVSARHAIVETSYLGSLPELW